MKIFATFIKTGKENIRDWKILILAIVFAPFFIYLMYLYLGNAETVTYRVVLLNLDQTGSYAADLITEWKNIKTEDNKSVLSILPVTDGDTARNMIRDSTADLFITIPHDFSESLQQYLAGTRETVAALINYGDQADLNFMLASSFADYAVFTYLGRQAGISLPMQIRYEAAGIRRQLRDFDIYVPALLVMSVIMILFTTGASVIREVEKETINRLILSKLSSFEFITALTVNQILIGIVCLLLTLLAAFSVGYQTGGSIALLLLIGLITSFAVISTGIITACFIKNMFGLLTVGCFPFFILIFFSDCFMPLPKINLIKIFGNQLYLNDILPTATATRALNKVLNYQSGLPAIGFELLWMTILSIIYFMVGVLFFKRKYMHPGRPAGKRAIPGLSSR